MHNSNWLSLRQANKLNLSTTILHFPLTVKTEKEVLITSLGAEYCKDKKGRFFFNLLNCQSAPYLGKHNTVGGQKEDTLDFPFYMYLYIRN